MKTIRQLDPRQSQTAGPTPYILHMKNHLPSLVALAAIGLFSACSKAPQAPPAPKTPEKTFEITADDQMKFSVTSIDAKAGQTIAVTLKNAGTMPKVSMGHNFVLLDKGVDAAKFVEASQTQMANDFIAPEFKNKVLAHTKLLGPGESDTIVFTVPRIPSPYTFICSFPGHFAIGMKGTLNVQ
jgi:azurin